MAYVHYPLAEGAVAPPTDKGYYAPLSGIRLPEQTRFVAGFVHEKRTLAEHRQILASIEAARGQSVDIACSCGLGRRSVQTASQLLSLMAELSKT